MVIGESRLVTATFRDTDGVLVDPTSVTLTVRDPSGDTTNPPIDNPSTGVYTATIDFDESGWWNWRWEGETDEGTVVAECAECIERSKVEVLT